MQRFFVPAEILQGPTVTLRGELAHQLASVLRLRPGARILLLDGAGWEYEVELQAVREKEVNGQAGARRPAPPEPPARVTLYQSLLKKDHFEWALQKCTEVGVAAFAPIISRRTIAHDLDDVTANKQERWRRILTEAAEQSHRGRVPVLHPVQRFETALAHLQPGSLSNVEGCSILLWEEADRQGLGAMLKSVGKIQALNLFIGPEGGYEAGEVERAQVAGVQVASLGPRILRAETAAVVAATLALYEMGGMDFSK